MRPSKIIPSRYWRVLFSPPVLQCVIQPSLSSTVHGEQILSRAVWISSLVPSPQALPLGYSFSLLTLNLCFWLMLYHQRVDGSPTLHSSGITEVGHSHTWLSI